MQVTFKLGDTAFSELVQPRIVKNDVVFVFVFFVLALRQRSISDNDVVLVVGEEREAAFEVAKLVHTVKREKRRGGGGGFERVETELGSDGVPVLETVSFNCER